jgi:ABC-type branched-subunit amino acid transport system substrate-binding protein
MRLRTRLVIVAFLTLAGCPKRVVVNGQEMPAAAAQDLARAEVESARVAGQGRPAREAADLLSQAGARFAGVEAGGDALLEAATLYRAAGDPARAAEALSRLLTENPLHPRANEAKVGLASAQTALGRARDALQTLGSVYPHLPASEKPGAAAQAAEAAVAARAWLDAIAWLGIVAEREEGAAREATVARAVEIVDGRLDFLEVARLRESLPRESPILPAATMKLARIHLHLRDHASAEREAREVFLSWPDGPYAADARAIVDRIAKLTFVRPEVIGLAIPRTGPYTARGDAILQAVALAVEGQPGVKLAVRDTRGEADGAHAAVEALALEEGAIAVIGGATNAEGERAAAAAEELQVPFVTLSWQEGVTQAGPHVFQNMLTASAQARALVSWAMGARGMKRFALMYPTLTYGTDLANAFWDEVEARGGEIRAAESYAPDRTTFTPLVKSMVGKLHLDERTDFEPIAKEIVQREQDPFRRRKALEKAREQLAPITDFDAIFIPDFARNVKLVAPALAVEDVVTQTCLPDEVARIRKTTGRAGLAPVQLLGGNGWATDPSLFDTSPGAPGRHVRCAVFVDGFHAGSARPETRRFVEAYQRKYAGKTPTILEASAYDAVRMARGLVDRGARTRAALRDGLAALRGFKGATGDIAFGPDRTPEKELFFLVVAPDGLRELTRDELLPPGAGGP